MYKNNIIVLIKKDGQPLRETHGKFVYLPFNSEYTIELVNQSYRRAIASIKIDGTDVLGGQEIILPAYSRTPVERFITDGNLASGRKLKFVPLSNSKVQDPSSPENGLVEIEVWFEKPLIRNISWTTTYTPPQKWDDGSGSSPWGGTHIYRCSSNSAQFVPDSNMSVMNCSIGSTIESFSASPTLAKGEAGATVEGSKSDQSFVEGQFGQKDYPSTTFKIWLKGVEREVTTEDKLYCTNCGKKMRFDYKFCPRCGSPVQIA